MSAGSARLLLSPETPAAITVSVRSPGVPRPSARPARPRVSAKAAARRSRASVSPRRGPNRAMIRWAGPRHARNSTVVPRTAMISKPATASHSGNLPAATRSPTVNITRSAGSGIGTPASIGRSSTRASGPLRPATPAFISCRAWSSRQPGKRSGARQGVSQQRHPPDPGRGGHAAGAERRAEPRRHERVLFGARGPHLRHDERAVVGGPRGVREQPGGPVALAGVHVDAELLVDGGVLGLAHAGEFQDQL